MCSPIYLTWNKKHEVVFANIIKTMTYLRVYFYWVACALEIPHVIGRDINNCGGVTRDQPIQQYQYHPGVRECKKYRLDMNIWWRHQMETFSALLAIFVREIHRSPVNVQHKGQWHGALMFSFISARINGWVKIVRLVIWDAIAPIMTSL